VTEALTRPGGAPRLLLVDDDHDVRELLAQVLAASGFEVAVAANGREALGILRHDAKAGQLPRVVVLDVHMPVMDGSEFRALQKADPELASIPVVAITSDWDARPDAHATLKKPLEFEKLLATLHQFR
jgi:CheY-like chemotaxis protein